MPSVHIIHLFLGVHGNQDLEVQKETLNFIAEVFLEIKLVLHTTKKHWCNASTYNMLPWVLKLCPKLLQHSQPHPPG
jgi:hypothetical protein